MSVPLVPEPMKPVGLAGNQGNHRAASFRVSGYTQRYHLYNLAADRIAAIDSRLVVIGRKEDTLNDVELLRILAQERLALTNERISLTTQSGQFLPTKSGIFVSKNLSVL